MISFSVGENPSLGLRTLLTGCVLSVLVTGFLNRTACGQSPEVADLDPFQELQRQIDELKQQVEAAQAITATATDTASATATTKPTEEKPAEKKPAEKKPEKPTYPTVAVTGFLQADAGWFAQDGGNMAAVGDIQDGADFRRTRLAAKGKAWDNVNYFVEMDFATPGRPNFMDVWLELEDLGCGDLRIGQFRHPLGMDGLTSVKELTFLERSLPFAFLPFRQIGAQYAGHSCDEMFTWAISSYRFPTDAYGGNVGDNGGYGLATRLTTLLIDQGEAGVLHVGGGYTFGDPANDLLRYAIQPEFFVGETGGAAILPAGVPANVPFFVDTGTIPTTNYNVFNAEVGASWWSLHAQSEFFFSSIDQIGGPRLNFTGGYAQLGYILTGETRPYNKAAGTFGRITPCHPFGPCGCGAWELAGRWSYIDLVSGNIQGGRLHDLTLGLNWYLNKYTKFQFNYIHAFLLQSPAAAGPIVKNSNADILALRAQVDF